MKVQWQVMSCADLPAFCSEVWPRMKAVRRLELLLSNWIMWQSAWARLDYNVVPRQWPQPLQKLQ